MQIYIIRYVACNRASTTTTNWALDCCCKFWWRRALAFARHTHKGASFSLWFWVSAAQSRGVTFERAREPEGDGRERAGERKIARKQRDILEHSINRLTRRRRQCLWLTNEGNVCDRSFLRWWYDAVGGAAVISPGTIREEIKHEREGEASNSTTTRRRRRRKLEMDMNMRN